MSFSVLNASSYLTQEARSHLEQNGCVVVDCHLQSLPEDEICDALCDIDATIAGGEHYAEKVFHAADKLKIVARVGVGYDNVDTVAAVRHGAWVTTTPGATSAAVADFTLALILCLLRNVTAMAEGMKAGQCNSFAGRELGALTLGIVGTGSIGREVVKRAGAFGTRMLAFDLNEDHEFAKQWNVQYVPLDELMTKADVVSLHVPSNEQTNGLIDDRRLRLMKQEAYLVNTSRPAVVEKQALVNVLEAKGIAGAAIDVHDPMPCRPDDPLVLLDNVIATPWSAYNTQEAVANMCITAASEVVTVLHGGEPKYPVNKVG